MLFGIVDFKILHIHASYGSVLAYLKQKAGISQKQIEILKNCLLEQVDNDR